MVEGFISRFTWNILDPSTSVAQYWPLGLDTLDG
jgi:hypothetical protein